jgi:hypothetical protein
MDCPPTYKQIRLWGFVYLARKAREKKTRAEESQGRTIKGTQKGERPKERINI